MSSTIGVFAAARIIKRNTGETVPLWTPDRPFLTSVEIEFGLSLNGTIRATLEMPYSNGIQMLEEPGLIVQSNILQARVGYSASGWMTPWFVGLMNTPSAQIDSSGVSITLEANGGGALAMIRPTHLEWTGTREEILRSLASKFSWEVDIDDAGGMNKEKVTKNGAGSTVWLFIRQMLQDVGYDFWMGVNKDGKPTIFVRRRETWLATQTQRTFVMFGTVDLAKNQYPLLSFSCSSQAMFLFPGAEGVKEIYMDEDGNVISETADDKTTATASVGGPDLRVGGKANETDGATGATTDVVVDAEVGTMTVATTVADHEKAGALQSEADQRRVDGFQVTVTSIGCPSILPSDICQVVGMSKLYDGLYGVTKVTHKVDSSGFDTTWEGVKNAVAEGYGTGTKISAPENKKTDPANPNESP